MEIPVLVYVDLVGKCRLVGGCGCTCARAGKAPPLNMPRSGCNVDVICRERLFGSKQLVAGVAQAGDDVTLCIEMVIDGSHVDIDIIMKLLYGLYAFG